MEKYESGKNIDAKSIFYLVAEQALNYWTFPDVNIGKQMVTNISTLSYLFENKILFRSKKID